MENQQILYCFLILICVVQNCSDIVPVSLDRHTVEPGKEFSFTIETPFAPFDLAKTIKYQSSISKGKELPDYINFDSETLTYSGLIPPGMCFPNIEITVYEEGCEDHHQNSFEIEIYYEPLISNENPFNDKERTFIIGSKIELKLKREWFKFTKKNEITFQARLKPDPQTPRSQNHGKQETLPEWLNFNSDESELLLIGNIPYDYCYPLVHVQILVKDFCVTETMEIPITVTNHKPELTHPIKDQTFTVGENIQMSFPNDLFLDPEKSTILTYSLFQLENTYYNDKNHETAGRGDENAEEGDSQIQKPGKIEMKIPSWLTFDPANLSLSGIIPYHFCKREMLFKLIANDGCLVSSTDFSITILNSPPQGKSKIELNRILNAGQKFSFGFNRQDFHDPDGGQVLLYSTQSDYQDLPDWLNFQSLSTTFTGTVPVGECTNYDLLLIASDFCLETIVPFSLTIINEPPNLGAKIPDQYFVEKRSFKFSIPLHSFYDPENGELDILLKWIKDGEEQNDLPNWLQFDCKDWSVTGKHKKPTEIQLRAIALDNCNQVSQDFKIKIIKPKEHRSHHTNSITLWLVFLFGSAIGFFVIKKMQILNF
ncbi:dystroglycan-related [Anaeramoeba flamelloides]|uniref:Dystroglycan-related n=1 Tax=Anaeramoeba flamelloides TaxID=1746091 RepID=A0ABQ8Z2V8_9EUKA|nr:dystroglycan-related [Anaeramoeba flamelloides]